MVKSSDPDFWQASPEDIGDEARWEALEYVFSEDKLAPDVEVVAAGDFEPVFLEAKIKYGTVYRYENWTMPWWLAWTCGPALDESERRASEYAYKEFIDGLSEVET